MTSNRIYVPTTGKDPKLFVYIPAFTCTDYEAQLEDAHELAALGLIDRGEVKDYARRHTHYDR